MSFWEDVGMPIVIIIGCIAGWCAVLFFIFAALTKVECANLQEITKRHTEFRWVGGCYVEHEGELLPYDRWKLLDVRIKERK